MKKHISVLLAMILMLSSSFVVSANANGSMENFKLSKTYTMGRFVDVSNSDWYAKSVKTAYELSLVNGTSDATFSPYDNITIAEAITLASRMNNIYYGNTYSFVSGDVWYRTYVDYAIKNGIIKNSDYNNFDEFATRSQFAQIFTSALPNETLKGINKIEDNSIPDVKMQSSYSNAVYKLYRAGVLSGNDEYGTFAPDAPITRAEVAAILSRIVKPTERVIVNLKSKPVGTYSIMQDDGSLEAFKQRALVANFKVLIGGEEKSSDWENDKYYIHHSGIAGIPSETIIIPEKYIDSRYSDIYNDNVIVFKNSWVNPNLTGETTIPIYYFEYNLPFQIGGKTYNLSVVNTGGEVDFYGGIIINGDLKLYYPGKAGTESWTETISYNNYTAEAQKMIDLVAFPKLTINEYAVKEYINRTYIGKDVVDEMWHPINKINVGYLTDWENTWYITMNRENMYQPSKREGQIDWTTQNEYVFTPTDEKTIQWCQNHYGKYVVALVNRAFETPLMLAEISGYTNSKENAEIKAWYYTNGVLNIEWKQPEISFGNSLILKEPLIESLY